MGDSSGPFTVPKCDETYGEHKCVLVAGHGIANPCVQLTGTIVEGHMYALHGEDLSEAIRTQLRLDEIARLRSELDTALRGWKADVERLGQRQYALSTDPTDQQYSAALVVSAETGAILKSRFGKPPAAPIGDLIARSSLGSVPIAQHTKLLKATQKVGEALSSLLDEVGHRLTRERRQEIESAARAVLEATGG